jgi:hypothetical protein
MKKENFDKIGGTIIFIICVILVFILDNIKISTELTMLNFVCSILAGLWAGDKISNLVDWIWEYFINKTK